jgi:capsular exopolysaccharide synthesis family protein
VDLNLYLDILKRRAAVIVIVIALAVMVITLLGLIIPPTYTADTTVRVLLDVGLTDFVFREDYAEYLMNTYREVVLSVSFLEGALDRLPSTPPDLTAEDLLEDILVVDVVPKTELMVISVTFDDPILVRDMANVLAEMLVEYPQNLYVGNSKSTRQILEEQLANLQAELDVSRQRLDAMMLEESTSPEIDQLSSQIRFKEDAYDMLLDRYELARLNESLRANSITILSPAQIPDQPSNPVGIEQIALSIILGILGGIGLALAMENMETRIHSVQQLEHITNLPVLGVVSRRLIQPGTLEQLDPSPAQQRIKEAYRVLIPNMQIFTRRDVTLRSVLLTSAIQSEGKTMVAANLSQAIAEQGQTIFLVEANLRNPTLEKTFGTDSELGLSDFLLEKASLDQIFNPTKQTNLFFISSGKQVPNPTTLLASPTLNRFLDFIDARNQFAILDAPPVLGMADASVLAPKVSGVILIVGQEITSREDVLAALRQLQTARARMLGLIFIERN